MSQSIRRPDWEKKAQSGAHQTSKYLTSEDGLKHTRSVRELQSHRKQPARRQIKYVTMHQEIPTSEAITGGLAYPIDEINEIEKGD